MAFVPVRSEPQRVLFTGGRAPYTVNLARMFAAAGHRVFVAESLPQHLCRRSRAVSASFSVPEPNADPEGFVAALNAIVERERIDLLVPTCEEIFHVARARERLGAHCEVFAAPLAQLRTLHSKWDFIERVKGHGLMAPETHRVESREALARLMDEQPAGSRWVLKPVFSRFASSVHFVEAGGAVPSLDVSPERPWVVQRFVSGRAYCSYSIVREGVLTAHSAYEGNFLASGACIDFAPLQHPGLQAWVERFAQAEAFTGQLAFDFIEAPDGTLYPLECNPRGTSGVHLFAPEDGLDRAFWGPGPLVTPKADARAMVGLAMLVYGLAGVRSGARLAEWARVFTGSSDVLFRWRDPGPFFQQVALFGELLRRSRRLGVSAMAASTLDIEWNGEGAPEPDQGLSSPA